MGKARLPRCDRGGMGPGAACRNVATQKVVGAPGVELYGCDECVDRYRDTMPGVTWAPLGETADGEAGDG